MNLNIATAPTATVEEVRLGCHLWRQAKIRGNESVEYKVPGVDGYSHDALKNSFSATLKSLNNPAVAAWLFPHSQNLLCVDHYEVLRDYCFLTSTDKESVQAWVVITQIISSKRRPSSKHFLITCMLPAGSNPSQSTVEIEEVVRLYLDRRYVRRYGQDGFAFGVRSSQLKPIFSSEAPIKFVWLQPGVTGTA